MTLKPLFATLTFFRYHFTTLFLVLLLSLSAVAQTQRVVVVKVDGLPQDEVARFVRERDPRTGKSLLPWIDEVFYRNGTRLENFYVRGMSLSAPSWSLLDTGQHLQVKGNVEFDRLTLHSYDYLNFLPLYAKNVKGERVDMPGVEVLDELKTPLLMDAFWPAERTTSFQLYQRGVRWSTLQNAIPQKIKHADASDLISEWVLGINWRGVIENQVERDLIARLNNPQLRYFDYYFTEFDHAGHHNRDRLTHLSALQNLDALIGRLWTAVQNSPQGAETAFVMVSDHGFNSDEKVYSQGYNLVKLLGRTEGGGHHVVTKRRLLLEYAIKGIYPFIPLVTTTTEDSSYLRGQSDAYPTALLDFDGNERAAIHLRDSDLNTLHILLQQLQDKNLPEARRGAVREAFFTVLDRRRTEWMQLLTELRQELQVLGEDLSRQEADFAASKKLPPRDWTPAEKARGLDTDAQRARAQVARSHSDWNDYTDYARTLSNLLELRRDNFSPAQWRIPDLIAPRAMGLPNSVHSLQNYVVGLGPAGLVFQPDGALDLQQSFKRIDYMDLLITRSVRNNVQTGVSNRPVDFMAFRIPTAQLGTALAEFGPLDAEAVWVYGGADRQALILSRTDAAGELSLRYVPIANLRQDRGGQSTFERIAWRADLPLRMWEDANLAVAERAAWLNAWHTDADWLRVVHKTAYSNGLIGLHEQMMHHQIPALNPNASNLDAAERLRRRFAYRQRELAETDLLLVANNHWNFDVRGFNPGGNHGSFFRASTHSVLMFAGGPRTGIPRGRVVSEPYDSLSFVPTILAVMGERPAADGTPAPDLQQRGFRAFPGRVINEVAGGRQLAASGR